MQLWEFAVIKKEKRDKDGNLIRKAELLVSPQTILANEEKHAAITAARQIPDEHAEELDEVDVLVRPF